MRATGIVEREVPGQLLLGLGDALVGMQVDVFVLHALPQSLDEYVVNPAPLAVHADLDVVGLENRSELDAGELTALVGVEKSPAGQYLAMASWSASTQKSAVMLIDTRCARTRRVSSSLSEPALTLGKGLLPGQFRIHVEVRRHRSRQEARRAQVTIAIPPTRSRARHHRAERYANRTVFSAASMTMRHPHSMPCGARRRLYRFFAVRSSDLRSSSITASRVIRPSASLAT